MNNVIRTQVPNSEGFSKQNLWRMKQFYEAYADADEKLSTLSREIAWLHNTLIMSQCKKNNLKISGYGIE